MGDILCESDNDSFEMSEYEQNLIVLRCAHIMPISCDSDSSADSDIAPIRKRVRRLSSDENFQFSDNELPDNTGLFSGEWNWEEKDNILKIHKFAEGPGISATVLRRLCVLEEILAKDWWEIVSKETNRYAE
uniref:Uncharacterized protein n=1 Tax=Glossina austeni TaxID=7395 RepID=A0A1A9USE3_GLOAU